MIMPTNSLDVSEDIKTAKSGTSQAYIARRDWAFDLPHSDHVDLFRSTNWSASHLGPHEEWGLALRLHVHTVFAEARAVCLYWGPQKVAIYNEAFVPLAGKAHPEMMGSTFQQTFPEIWDDIRGLFDHAEGTGLCAEVNEIPLFVERHGYLEETHFTGGFTPVRDEAGNVQGFFNLVYEVTKQKLRDRRTATINSVAASHDSKVQSIWGHIIQCLETNPFDIPMALIYEVDEESSPSLCLLKLQGQIGVPRDHALALDNIDLGSPGGIIPQIKKAKPGFITSPVDAHFEGITWHGFGEPSKTIGILPLTVGDKLLGFLVLGTNPRRRLDEDDIQFMQDLSMQLASRIASEVSIKESERRENRLQSELAESERQIRYLAEHASVGMQHISPDGTTIWANDRYYELTGHSRSASTQHEYSFFDVIHEDDRKKAEEAWARLMNMEPRISVELRLKKLFYPPVGKPEPACILALAFPYLENDKIKSVMSCNTDISALKWAESWQARSAQEARDAKQKQEEYIDLISHEMRNPLSAILQCAESIMESLKKELESESSSLVERAAIANSIDDVQSITTCANHQRRIIDDMLTLSKFQTLAFSISPTPVQIASLGLAVDMFQAQLRFHDIKMRLVAEDSIGENNISYILCDPSRISQILINLVTNAIKFTRDQATREINVKYGATFRDPRKAFPKNIRWASLPRQLTDDVAVDTESDVGEPFYVTFVVEDTGLGMSESEMSRLFDRFAQANLKTHVQYGGHGLGLFISRGLAEMQGGEIGVASEAGKGSTFAFYAKVRKASTSDLSSTTPKSLEPSKTSSNETQEKVLDGTTTRLNGLTVLLVEDNLINQKVLARRLRLAGCDVHVASHGVEALEAIRNFQCWHEEAKASTDIDIVLMDLEMPIMDGLTCSREIRALEKQGKITKHLEIMAITANARAEQIASAIDAGIDTVLPKPFTAFELLQKIKERSTHMP